MRLENVEAFYPLSPLQEGMLFHSLVAPESGLYFNQAIATLRGDFNVSAFERSWQRVMDRHPVLRSSCAWEGLKAPIQVVDRQVNVPFEQHDLRALSLIKQQERLESLLQAEQKRGFDLSNAPLMRLMLIQMADDHYEFNWSFHHILLDGWSMFLVFKEVFALFEAFSRGEELHLEHPRPFRDYIVWLQQQNLSKAETFWRKKLKGFTAPTPLVVGRALGSVVSEETDIDSQQIHLSPATTVALQSLSSQHHLTLNTLVQGTWALLLSRYSGEEDVAYGSVVSGRPAAMVGVESMLGLFINTLPVRVQVPPSDSLLDWLKKLQVQQVELREYEYSPLVEVQGWSDVPRGLPLFESIFLFENYRKDVPLEEMGGSLEIQNVRWVERVNYPLAALAVQGTQMLLRIIYHCSRFDVPTIMRMLEHWRTLLEGLVANPECRLSDLPMLTATERDQLLVVWNDTLTDYPKDKCIHELFEAQVARAPDAVAVAYEDEKLTYRELNARANQLAHYLRKLNVGPEVLVGICIERSLEMVVGLLGILKAGGAYVPLDPAYPKERLAFMLEDTQAPLLLTQEQLVEDLPEHSARAICVDTGWDAIAVESEENPFSGATDENLAYVIYTSGSTGKPKGSMNTHRGVANRLLWMQDAYQLTEADRILQKTAFSFDVSVWEFFWPLLTGARLVVARPGGHQDSAYLVNLIAEQKITTIHFVPSMLRVFLEEQRLETCRWLKRVICSGEALNFDLQERFFNRLGAELHNLYGPTEAAIDVTFWACKGDSHQRVIPIGRPIANVHTYILDASLQPVPIGVPGELHLGGVGLARGYFDRPDLTAEKFFPNPFSQKSGDRLYRTGDLARYLPDGNIEFLGRFDDQMKIRGFRIEPGEIEAVLAQHPAVREAVVLAREDAPGDKRLVAYVVAQAEQPTVSELYDFLKAKLPDYMMPSAFVFLEALPLTPSSKVDRAALPTPTGDRPKLNQTFVAPRNKVEQALAGVWGKVLGRERVGVHDNFFEIGGHSLLATQVVSRLNERLDTTIPLRTLFEHPTLAELAVAVEKILVAETQPLSDDEAVKRLERYSSMKNSVLDQEA